VKEEFVIPVYSGKDLAFLANWTFELLGESLSGDWQVTLATNWIRMTDLETGEVEFVDGATSQEHKHIVVFAWQECLADSAFIREIFSALRYPMNEEAVQRSYKRATDIAVKELCPDNYERKEPPPKNTKAILRYR